MDFASIVHGTGRSLVPVILETGLRPGWTRGGYLAGGCYGYFAPTPAAQKIAMRWAKSVAGRQYADIGWLGLEIAVDRALNLQDDNILQALRAFVREFGKRLDRSPFLLEADTDACFFRPRAEVLLSAFVSLLEADSGLEIDAVSAQYNRPNTVVDDSPPPEVCVRRARAILRTYEIDPTQPQLLRTGAQPTDWQVQPVLLKAAQAAAGYARAMSDAEFADLFIELQRGPVHYGGEAGPRLTGDEPVHFVYDSGSPRHRTDLKRILDRAGQRAGRSVRWMDVARFKRLNSTEAAAERRRMLEGAAGFVFAPPCDHGPIRGLLQTVLDQTAQRPVLIVTDEPVSPEVMAYRNVACVDATHLRGADAEAIFTGCLGSRWRDVLEVRHLSEAIAARCGTPGARERDARIIMETYRARDRSLLRFAG